MATVRKELLSVLDLNIYNRILNCKAKICLLAVFVMIGIHAQGQYIPNNAQPFQFASVFNPAFSGIENFNDLKLSYRYQWTGFGENAPKFVNMAYNTRLRQPVDLTYNSLRISNPSMVRSQHIPRGKRVIHGLGLNLFQSKVGVIKSIGGGVNFALNYPLIRQWRFSFAMGAIVENRKLDITRITVRESNDPFYNHLLNSSTSQTDLNVRAGVLFYNNEFYAGFSYLPLIFKAIKTTDLAFEEAFYKASAQAGYAFQVNEDLALKPSILALLQLDNSVALDVSVKGYIRDRIWTGITYRSVKSGIAMLGFNINEIFSFSYAYEISLSDFQQFNGGSHELLLGVKLHNIKKSGQYTW